MMFDEERERLKFLLKDTITLLCKNSLTYSGSFTLQALIGITLEENDIILLNINETVCEDSDSNCAVNGEETDIKDPVSNDLSEDENYSKNIEKNKLTDADIISLHKRAELNVQSYNSFKLSQLSNPNYTATFFKEVNQVPQNTSPTVSPLNENGFNTTLQLTHNTPSMIAFPEREPPGNLQFPTSSQPSGIQSVDMSGAPALIATAGVQQHYVAETSDFTPKVIGRKKGRRNRLGSNSATQCNICHQVFASSTNLEGHKYMKHRIGDPISCECGKQFPYRTNYYSHRKNCVAYLSKSIESIEGLDTTENVENAVS